MQPPEPRFRKQWRRWVLWRSTGAATGGLLCPRPVCADLHTAVVGGSEAPGSVDCGIFGEAQLSGERAVPDRGNKTSFGLCSFGWALPLWLGERGGSSGAATAQGPTQDASPGFFLDPGCTPHTAMTVTPEQEAVSTAQPQEGSRWPVGTGHMQPEPQPRPGESRVPKAQGAYLCPHGQRTFKDASERGWHFSQCQCREGAVPRWGSGALTCESDGQALWGVADRLSGSGSPPFLVNKHHHC